MFNVIMNDTLTDVKRSRKSVVDTKINLNPVNGRVALVQSKSDLNRGMQSCDSCGAPASGIVVTTTRM